jgi:ATP-dependent exoDNAse (exonuclease V) beta subunit
VAEHDFDLALLARADGDRRLANVRKLIRLAREYEQLRGPDLEGFVQFCEEQADLASREGDAAIADEGGDAVMLMTVHAAKGLEFEVVVIADAGRRPGGRYADVVLDRRGRVGFRAAPDTGINRLALGMKELQDAEARADAEEGRRKQYVAMTRARRHLIISGGVDQPTDNTPMGALTRTLEVGLHSEGVVDLGRTSVVVSVVRPAGDAPPQLPEFDQLPLFGESPETLPDLEAFEPLVAPPAHAIRRMSYSGLALYDRCGYRFYAQRLLRLPEREPVRELAEGMAGVEIGDAVHLLLERDDGRWRELYPHATAENDERIARMVSGWRASELAGRLAGLDGVTLEQPFAFDLDGVLFRGRFDAYHQDPGGSALVVDYKTNLLGETDPEDIVDRSYRHQVAIYALAVLTAGAREVEVAYAFLDRPGSVVTRSYTAGDADTLRGGLRESLSPILAGRFEARPGPWCAECPALDLLCAGPALPTE